MNEKIKLSIIIPIYGVEYYISDFLDSLLFQLTDEVECIFVDDGSKDKSILILEEKLKKLEKIEYKILRQENKGVSAARNNGLKISKGEYFVFLDPDDEVYPDYIFSLIRVINKNDVDMIHINADMYCKTGEIKILKLSEKERVVYVNDDFLSEHFKKCLWYPWLVVFNKKYKNFLQFKEISMYEDMMSIPCCYEDAKKVYELPKKLIKYKYRDNSAINNKVNLDLQIRCMCYGLDFYRNKKSKIYTILTKCFFMMAVFNLHENKIKLKKFLKKHNKDYLIITKNAKYLNLTKKDLFFTKHYKLKEIYEYQKKIFNLKLFKRN